jgi:ABC-type amino acid transport substrate-binding protein
MKRGISAVLKTLCLLLPLWCVATWAATPSATPPAKANAEPTSPLVRVADGRMLAPDIARIINRGELIVAVLERDTPPFVYQKNGELVGVDIALVRQVSSELKVPIRFDRSAKTYDEVVQQVASGQADLGVSKLARTLKRAQSVQFSDPYMRLEHSLLINRLAFANVARERSVSQAVRNFTGTIGVLAGSAWEEFARRNFTQAKVVPFATWPKAVDAAKRGEVVAAYRDAIEVRTVMKADPSLALTMRTVSFTDLQSVLCVMVGSRDNMLLAFVNEIVANQTEPPTVSALLQKMQ